MDLIGISKLSQYFEIYFVQISISTVSIVGFVVKVFVIQ